MKVCFILCIYFATRNIFPKINGHLTDAPFHLDSTGIDFCVAKFEALNKSESPMQIPGTSGTTDKSFEGNCN